MTVVSRFPTSLHPEFRQLLSCHGLAGTLNMGYRSFGGPLLPYSHGDGGSQFDKLLQVGARIADASQNVFSLHTASLQISLLGSLPSWLLHEACKTVLFLLTSHPPPVCCSSRSPESSVSFTSRHKHSSKESVHGLPPHLGQWRRVTALGSSRRSQCSTLVSGRSHRPGSSESSRLNSSVRLPSPTQSHGEPR